MLPFLLCIHYLYVGQAPASLTKFSLFPIPQLSSLSCPDQVQMLAMFCLLSFMFWTLPDASGCSLFLNSAMKTFPHTMKWSYVSFYSNQLQDIAGGSCFHEFLTCSWPDSSKDFTTCSCRCISGLHRVACRTFLHFPFLFRLYLN